MKLEQKVRVEISEILKSKESRASRDEFVKELSDFVWTEAKRVNDIKTEELLREKNKHVYN